MTRIKQEDVVQVLPGYIFSSLVYSTGVVLQSLNCRMALVRFPQKRNCTLPEDLESFQCQDWIIPFDKLKVLDSPYDNRIGLLEEEILGLESDLMLARSCLGLSEDLRDQQQELIQKLIEDLDRLKAEVYHLQNRKLN